MELVLSQHIDKKQWDQLVERSGGTVFSLSAYLDATADNWAVLYNADRSEGIACPFSVKLGIRVLYAPFFHRYTEWLGNNPPSEEELIKELKIHFPVADAQLKWENENHTRYHQVLTREGYKPNQQVKRMLKKATGFEVVEQHKKPILAALLKSELSHRIAAIDDHSLGLLENLVDAFNSRGGELLQLNLESNGEWLGGIWLLVFNNRVLYLKGTVTKEAKENGGMYRLMEHALKLAFDRDLLFDFGGSNVEGVRRFNLNWGSSDVTYGHLEWNNAPLWWKTLKSLRKKWSKRSS